MIISRGLFGELNEMPTAAVGQADDLKIDSVDEALPVGTPAADGYDGWRLWLCRVTDEATGELRLDGRWRQATDGEVAEMLAIAHRHHLISTDH